MRIAFTTLISLSVVGCFPYRFTERPGLSGRVVSAASLAPVPGAVVRFKVVQADTVLESGELLAAADGSFSVRGQTFWGAHGFEMAMGPRRTGTIEVTAQGFEAHSRELQWSISGPSTLKFGEIHLSPAQETPNTSLERTRER